LVKISALRDQARGVAGGRSDISSSLLF